jgi:pimeloyl-ACP methyl ester carboxylesterase
VLPAAPPSKDKQATANSSSFFLVRSLKVEAAETLQGLIPVDIGNATLMASVWTPESSHYETIIALPGSGGDTSRFRLIGPLLANAGFQLVALNQRGIMGSTGALDDLTLYDFADDVIAVADALKQDRFQLLGWALGNRISRAAATKYPDRIATVSLIAAGGLGKATHFAGRTWPALRRQ